jgi:hypothetical protein
MNERIKELAEQCWKERPADQLHFDTEKFAELIVQGCITTVLEESKWYWDKDEWESSDAIQNAAWRIKERFGVK